MEYDPWFDSIENRTLIAICTRKLIRNIGVGGIIWGLLNIVIGALAIRVTIINAGILILGVMMLGAGVRALKNPSLEVLRIEIFVTILLFLWNLGISILNATKGYGFNLQGLIFPLVIACVFGKNYRKLKHLRDHIASIGSDRINDTQRVCKVLLKKKYRDDPAIVQTTDGRCRAQLMDDQSFFVQRDFMKAFAGPKEAIRSAVENPDAKTWKLVFNHPLGKLKYRFSRKNSDKIKLWLSKQSAPAIL